MAAAKFKVSDIAKRMGKSEKDVVTQLQALGAEITDASQILEPEVIQALITGKKLLTRTRSVIMREDKPLPEKRKEAVRPPRPIVPPPPRRVAVTSPSLAVDGEAPPSSDTTADSSALVAADPPANDAQLQYDRYTIDEAMVDVFVERRLVDEILRALEVRRNVILQGAPGVGKTFVARRLAKAHIGVRAPGNIVMVQFHQSYGYEDFVQGFRPTAGGGFELRNGPLFRIATAARQKPTERFVLVIDEINRGNVSRIFGELLLLVEHDKRDREFGVSLTYSPDEPFFLPPNLYVIGLMNTADRSLAIVDYALRRRFSFFTIPPAFDSPIFQQHLLSRGASKAFADGLLRRLGTLNQKIRKDRGLGPGFDVGHSFFCLSQDDKCDREWLQRVIERDIRPLLREYWFDTPERADEESTRLLG